MLEAGARSGRCCGARAVLVAPDDLAARRDRGELEGLAPKKRGPKAHRPDRAGHARSPSTSAARRAEAPRRARRGARRGPKKSVGVAGDRRSRSPRRGDADAASSISTRRGSASRRLCDALGVRTATLLPAASRPAVGRYRRGSSPRALCRDESAGRARRAARAALRRPRARRGLRHAARRGALPLLGAHDVPRPRRQRTRCASGATSCATRPTPQPELLATAPNQLWSWDITKLLGPGEVDLLLPVRDPRRLQPLRRRLDGRPRASRATLAEQLIAETVRPPGHRARPAHAPRRPRHLDDARSRWRCCSPTSASPRRHSRPHVSNDNPFSEAQFKTLKYRPDFPDRFGCIEDARAPLRRLLPLVQQRASPQRPRPAARPHDVHYGLADQRVARRAPPSSPPRTPPIPSASSAAHPHPPPLPTAVWINKPKASTPPRRTAAQGAAELTSSPALAPTDSPAALREERARQAAGAWRAAQVPPLGAATAPAGRSTKLMHSGVANSLTGSVDSTGNMYAVGEYTGTLNLGGPTPLKAVSANPDVYLVKYSIAGSHQWSKSYGNPSRDLVSAVGIDTVGNVLVSGMFSNTINLGGNDLSSAGNTDIFVAHFNASDGSHRASLRLGGTAIEVVAVLASQSSAATLHRRLLPGLLGVRRPGAQLHRHPRRLRPRDDAPRLNSPPPTHVSPAVVPRWFASDVHRLAALPTAAPTGYAILRNRGVVRSTSQGEPDPHVRRPSRKRRPSPAFGATWPVATLVTSEAADVERRTVLLGRGTYGFAVLVGAARGWAPLPGLPVGTTPRWRSEQPPT